MPLKIRFRFSLRALLVAIACVSIFLATVVVHVFYPSWRERSSISLILESVPGAQVFTEPKGQFTFRHFFGDFYSERAVHVHLSDRIVTDEWIAKHLLTLNHLETLSITSCNVTDAAMTTLSSLPNLRSLNLVDTKIATQTLLKFRKDNPRIVVSRALSRTAPW